MAEHLAFTSPQPTPPSLHEDYFDESTLKELREVFKQFDKVRIGACGLPGWPCRTRNTTKTQAAQLCRLCASQSLLHVRAH